MSFLKNCCEWTCARIVAACYDPNDLISVASTEHLLSRPVREVIEAGIHEKMYRQKQLFNRHGYNLAIFKGGHVKGKIILDQSNNLPIFSSWFLDGFLEILRAIDNVAL